MVDYNDGKWHGWNGGECPVHPMSVVQVALKDCCPVEDMAEQWFWDGDKCRIVAFRVVKEHREPREWWIAPGSSTTPATVKNYHQSPWPGGVRVREVLADDEAV